MGNYEPRIIAFFCNWCAYSGVDSAGVGRIQYPPNIKIIRAMCSARIDPVFILDSFIKGADGVLIGGCHPGECNYDKGNITTKKRIKFLKKAIESAGIDLRRLRLEWISSSEGDKFARIANEMVEDIKELGPLKGRAGGTGRTGGTRGTRGAKGERKMKKEGEKSWQ